MLQRKDVLGGALLVACGVLGLVLGASLDLGSARRMGPGFLPTILSWLLILLGGLIGFGGVRRGGERASRIAWRPVILVVGAVIVFSALIDRVGLVATTAGVVGVGAFAGRDVRPVEAVVLAGVMAVGAAALFVYGLGLPLPLWGR